MDCKDYVEERKKLWSKTKDIELDYEWRRASWLELIENTDTFKELLENPWYLMEMHFCVIDKEFNEVPFFLNEVQSDFLNNVLLPLVKKQNEKEIEQIKIKILKGRQQGFTTLITAFQECLMLTQDGFRGFTMAHDSDATGSIFSDIAKGFFDGLIDEIKEKPKRSNARELVFQGNNSAWRVATAGSSGAGRGKKLKMLHNSEKAFWKDMRKNSAAISQALTKYSIEIDETTANGYNEFKEDWDAIKEGKSKWIACFYEWYRTFEYRKSFKGVEYTEEEFKAAIEKEERFKGVDSKFIKLLKSLIHDTKLDIEQVHWYFDKRLELKEDVYQEYPCTDEMAFLHSGRPYFDIELLDILINKNKNVQFESLYDGEIEVFEKPQYGVKYIIGSDVAEGLEMGDNSTFTILRADTLVEVVSAEYKATPDEHGLILAHWGKKYNNAFIGVERNNHGHSTLNTLINTCNYKNLFIEKTLDKKRNKETDKPGWSTNPKSKYIMLDDLDTALRNEEITVKSVKTLKQMREIQKEDGKVETNGKDRVIGLAIAYQMYKNRPRKATISAKPF
ncbi:hypothetical protein [Fusobacterium ulcerans]|uniref:hypothetical protein n=1 Tax=Fusobacterium ulcerans TaxID=861 RepID=UPI00267365BC|nr:hypothetical protein [Fusobacterium ulcerans]